MPTLDWMTRAADVVAHDAVAYRLLERVPALDGGDGDPRNLLIQGDNLDALKALLPYYRGRVKCIYIDPPYNTRSAFEHYDDNLEHSQWLAMIYPRLVLLRELLAEDGSIWVSIDDNEGHYLKVAMDEVFGRRNFVVNVLWQKRIGPDNRLAIGDAHDHILVYGKTAARFLATANRLALTSDQLAEFRNPDDDLRGPWTSSSNFSAQGFRPNQMYKITSPGAVEYDPPPGRCWVTVESEYLKLRADGRLWFGRDGKGMPRKKVYLREQQGRVSWSWWTNAEVGNTQESKREINQLFGSADAFDTPKPERLMQRIIHIASNPGDLVLDSFLGSGTTAAVAHKMGRRWIGIEMGDHAVTHCKPRLDKVIAGEAGGVSAAVGWTGGGGYRFHRLGAPAFDGDGRICADIDFATLAAHIWFAETGTPYWLGSATPDQVWGDGAARSPVIGVHDGTAYALLYNGILGDKSVSGGNVLTGALLDRLRGDLSAHVGRWIVYGEACRLGPARLAAAGVTFRQTPYDVRAR